MLDKGSDGVVGGEQPAAVPLFVGFQLVVVRDVAPVLLQVVVSVHDSVAEDALAPPNLAFVAQVTVPITLIDVLLDDHLRAALVVYCVFEEAANLTDFNVLFVPCSDHSVFMVDRVLQ